MNKRETMFFLSKKKILDEMKQSWWVVLIIALFYLVIHQMLEKQNLEYLQLRNQYLGYVKQKNLIESENNDLLLEISSQDDPDYIELTLKRVLGLVSKGEQKFFFAEGDSTDLYNNFH